MVNRTSKCFGFFVSILILLVPYSSQSQGVNPNTPDQIRRAYDKAFETMFQDPGNLEKTFSFAGADAPILLMSKRANMAIAIFCCIITT